MDHGRRSRSQSVDHGRSRETGQRKLEGSQQLRAEPILDPQAVKEQIERERQEYIKQRLLRNKEPLPPRIPAVLQSTAAEEASNETCNWLHGEVPTLEELRLQVQREREAYIGRMLHVGEQDSNS